MFQRGHEPICREFELAVRSGDASEVEVCVCHELWTHRLGSVTLTEMKVFGRREITAIQSDASERAQSARVARRYGVLGGNFQRAGAMAVGVGHTALEQGDLRQLDVDFRGPVLIANDFQHRQGIFGQPDSLCQASFAVEVSGNTEHRVTLVPVMSDLPEDL